MPIVRVALLVMVAAAWLSPGALAAKRAKAYPTKACVASKLEAAADHCAAVLKAHGAGSADPARRDARVMERRPDRTRPDAAAAKARQRFDRAWTKATKRCTPAGTATAVGGQVDALAADVVRQTTVSPKVGADAFTTISPTGTVRYRDLTATCIKGTPYHFFVKRGTVNKLLMYYQGGGACWEDLTCSIPACDPSVDPGDNPENAPGFFDLTNPDNPFRDWSIVFTSYCSCDIHFGDAEQSYAGGIQHRGYQDARVVEKWAREHFVSPEVVFVTGTSAGAYGAWFNAPLLQEVRPAAQLLQLGNRRREVAAPGTACGTRTRSTATRPAGCRRWSTG